MNEPVTKSRTQTDFEEFERYMRESAKLTRAQPDDPLAELARLVGNDRDPYEDVFSRDSAASGRAPAPPRSAVDFATIEAGLRGSLPGHAGFDQTGPDHAGGGHDAFEETVPFHPDASYRSGTSYHPGGSFQTEPSSPEARAEAVQDYYDPQETSRQSWAGAPGAEPGKRSRRPILAMSAIILIGVAGIGIAFAYKGKNSGPREIAMIKADPGPAKIQPPADDSADQVPVNGGSMLDKTQQPSPVKTVTHEEQPVDLANSVRNVQNTPQRDPANGLAPIYSFGMSSPDTQPAAAPNAAQVASADEPAQHGIANDIPPIRVKTRSYRPDGTPIQDDHIPAAAIEAAAAQPAAPQAKSAIAAVAKASTPKAPITVKTTTRAAPAVKPLVVASTDPDAPTDLTPPGSHTPPKAVKPMAPPKPLKTASVDDSDGAAQPAALHTEPSGGGFAVQLAAPGTEAEAKQTAAHLAQKFASDLQGHHLGTYKAVSNGKTVYRLRTGGMTREDATGLCEKLKASGGSCFITKS